jgi:transposase-like protein
MSSASVSELSTNAMSITHQRCRIHWMRNALAHASAKQRTAVAAMLKTIFAQETKAEAETPWEIVADALREKQPKLAALMDSPATTSWPTCPSPASTGPRSPRRTRWNG